MKKQEGSVPAFYFIAGDPGSCIPFLSYFETACSVFRTV
jgi:hypothetical protein